MTPNPHRVLVVVGARPNFVKAGPVLHAMAEKSTLKGVLLHTGQHYDEKMSNLFFDDLGLPNPDVNLEVGSGSHAAQTAEIMIRFESYLQEKGKRPSCVMVVGDVNSTVACALVAAKAGVPLVHVEAGLRSFDRSMPEEINRICTDQIADVCYITERSGQENLEHEGKPARSLALVGNTMIDSLLRYLDRGVEAAEPVKKRLELVSADYAVCTLHRPSNVDSKPVLTGVLDALESVSSRIPIVLPEHPRLKARMDEFGLADRLQNIQGMIRTEPLGYLEFMGLMSSAALVLSDSGGIQEETTVLKIPCVTLRSNTERPITLEMGGNVLAGNDPERIVSSAEKMMALDRETIETPPLWDGEAAVRLVDDLESRILEDHDGRYSRGRDD